MNKLKELPRRGLEIIKHQEAESRACAKGDTWRPVLKRHHLCEPLAGMLWASGPRMAVARGPGFLWLVGQTRFSEDTPSTELLLGGETSGSCSQQQSCCWEGLASGSSHRSPPAHEQAVHDTWPQTMCFQKLPAGWASSLLMNHL